MNKKETITEILRRTIRESGISQRRLSIETGVDRMSINFFMRGRALHSDNLDVLAEYFGLTLVKREERKGK